MPLSHRLCIAPYNARMSLIWLSRCRAETHVSGSKSSCLVVQPAGAHVQECRRQEQELVSMPFDSMSLRAVNTNVTRYLRYA